MSKSLRLLIADAHPSVRLGLRHIIEQQEGWAVVGEATDGRHAVELAREHKPDVVVLDLNIPDLNGVEATRQLRKLHPPPEVLILTMLGSEAMITDALDAGAHGHIFKTDPPVVILAAIESVAEKRPSLPGAAGSVVAGPSGAHPRLTPREREIVKLFAEGHTNKEVAQRLGISPKTADVHRTNIMRRLNFHSVAELVSYAIRERLIEP